MQSDSPFQKNINKYFFIRQSYFVYFGFELLLVEKINIFLKGVSLLSKHYWESRNVKKNNMYPKQPKARGGQKAPSLLYGFLR
jgi:hypothetical protein